MFVRRIALVFLLSVGLALPAPVLSQVMPEIDGRGIPTIAPLLQKVTPAVVNITVVSERNTGTYAPDPFFSPFFAPPKPQRQVSAGSGVIVDAQKGYVLTNNHVVESGGQVTVTLKDRRSFEATVVGRDKATDLALLQIPAEDLTAIPMGDSEKLLVGDFVVAIGNPFDLGQTVTSGIVSALGRSGINPEGYEDFIQTDASINPGNSGGALITYDGKLVGINTAIIAPSGGNVGIGFAIPINMARAVMDQLVEFGQVRRGLLGITTQDLTPEIAEALGLSVTEGALVAQVESGSAAQDAGLQPGDVIVAINDETISDSRDLRGHLGVMRPGTEFDLRIVRRDGTRNVKARLRETGTARWTAKSRLLNGAVLAPLTQGLPGYGQVQGIAVIDVARGSPAARFGLRPEDVILTVNKMPVQTVQDLDRAVAQSRRAVAMTIWRHGSLLYLLIR